MTTNKPTILRRLKTKDGIVSPIQEMTHYRPEELRVLSPQLDSFEVSERLELGDESGGCVVKYRRYREVKRTYAVLIEMEES